MSENNYPIQELSAKSAGLVQAGLLERLTTERKQLVGRLQQLDSMIDRLNANPTLRDTLDELSKMGVRW